MMKLQKILCIVISLLMLLIFSCKDEETDDDPGDATLTIYNYYSGVISQIVYNGYHYSGDADVAQGETAVLTIPAEYTGLYRISFFDNVGAQRMITTETIYTQPDGISIYEITVNFSTAWY